MLGGRSPLVKKPATSREADPRGGSHAWLRARCVGSAAGWPRLQDRQTPRQTARMATTHVSKSPALSQRQSEEPVPARGSKYLPSHPTGTKLREGCGTTADDSSFPSQVPQSKGTSLLPARLQKTADETPAVSRPVAHSKNGQRQASWQMRHQRGFEKMSAGVGRQA